MTAHGTGFPRAGQTARKWSKPACKNDWDAAKPTKKAPHGQEPPETGQTCFSGPNRLGMDDNEGPTASKTRKAPTWPLMVQGQARTTVNAWSACTPARSQYEILVRAWLRVSGQAAGSRGSECGSGLRHAMLYMRKRSRVHLASRVGSPG